jgi:hypothetical protein
MLTWWQRSNRWRTPTRPGNRTATAAKGRRTLLKLEVLEQRTVPSFLPPVNYPTGTQPASVATGDFNNDGSLDLAVSNLTSNTVSVFLGNGDGTFRSAVDYPVGMEPRFVVVADLNGDGVPDLVVVNHVGSFSAGSVSVLLGNGDGTFQPAIKYDVGTGPSSVAVADFNGDGIPDLVVTNYNGNNVSVLLGNGDGTFQSPVNFDTGMNPDSVAVGDFNGDGNTDLVVANRNSRTVSVLLGNGDATFQAPVPYTAGAGPFCVLVADLNGDGILDLAVANQNDNMVSVLLGNGDGTFQGARNYAAGSRPWLVVAADFNGDGISDLAVADNSAGVSVLLGNADGSFQAPMSFMAGSNVFSVAAGDFNGDTFPDLAVVNRFSNNMSVLINDGIWSGGSPSGHHDPSLQEIVTASQVPGTAAVPVETLNPSEGMTVSMGLGRGVRLPDQEPVQLVLGINHDVSEMPIPGVKHLHGVALRFAQPVLAQVELGIGQDEHLGNLGTVDEL